MVLSALLDSLMAERRNCHGNQPNGDRQHSPKCPRCRRGAQVAARREASEQS